MPKNPKFPTIRLPLDLYERIKAVADEERRTVSQQAAVLIEQGLATLAVSAPGRILR
jgi:predicted DNA-binding protein